MCGAVPSCSHLCTPPLLCCVGSFALVHWPDRGGLLLGESPLPLFYWPAAALLLHISPLFVSSAVLATPSYGDKKRAAFLCQKQLLLFFNIKRSMVSSTILPVLFSLTAGSIEGFSPYLMISDTATFSHCLWSQLFKGKREMAQVIQW